MHTVSFIYSNLSLYCFPFSSFQREFFLSPRTMAFFSPLSPSVIVFSIKLIDFLIAHECDHSFGFLLPSAIQYQAFIFSPFGGWQGDSGPGGGLPKLEFKTDRHSSSIACPQGASREGGCSTNAPIYIRPPPQKLPQIRGC